jgi:hypothetical protein
LYSIVRSSLLVARRFINVGWVRWGLLWGLMALSPGHDVLVLSTFQTKNSAPLNASDLDELY